MMTQNTQHTTGPWMADIDGCNSHQPMVLIVTGASNKNTRVQAIDCTGSGNNYAEDCANARLIARAPTMDAEIKRLTAVNAELVAALSALTELVEAYSGHPMSNDQRTKNARAALERAQ